MRIYEGLVAIVVRILIQNMAHREHPEKTFAETSG